MSDTDEEASLLIQVRASLSDFSAKMDEFNNVIDGSKTHAEGFNSSWLETMKGVIGAEAIVETAKKAFEELKKVVVDSMKAADDDAVVMLRLKASLGEGAESIHNYAVAQEEKTRFQKIDTLAAADALTVHKLNREEILKLLPVIEDFATKKGVSATATAEAFGRAIEYGTTRGLRPFGIEVDKSGSQLDIFNALMDAGNGKVKGLAEQVGQIGLGPMLIFQNRIKEIEESFGEKLIPALNQFLAADGPQLLSLAENLAKNLLNIVTAIDAIWTMTSGRKGDWEKGLAMLNGPEKQQQFGAKLPSQMASTGSGMGGFSHGQFGVTQEESNLGTTPMGKDDKSGQEYWTKQHEAILSNVQVYKEKLEEAMTELNASLKTGETGLDQWYKESSELIFKSANEQIAVQQEIARTSTDGVTKTKAANEIEIIKTDLLKKQNQLGEQYTQQKEKEIELQKQIEKILEESSLKVEKSGIDKKTDPISAMKEQHDQQLLDIKSYYEKEEEIITKSKQKESDKVIQISKLESDKEKVLANTLAQNKIEIERAVSEAKIDFTKSTCEKIGDILGSLYELGGRQSEALFNAQKALSRVNIAITTAEAAMKAYNAYADIPDVGPVLGAIAAGVVIAYGAVQEASVASKKFEAPAVPRAATGGIIYGPSHSQGGVNINAEGGEGIINRAAVQTYGTHAIDAINAGMASIRVGGSSVTAATGGGRGSAAPLATIQITNLNDPRQIDRHLASADGRRSTINFMGQNKLAIRKALGV